VTDPREHLRALSEAAPPGSVLSIPRAWVAPLLAQPIAVAPVAPLGWTRERLYRAPADTMLSVREAAQALSKSPAAVHKPAARHRLPSTRAAAGHSPVAGPPLMFRAADLRRFLERRKAA